ncbi:WD40 repeat domain-containing protein [Endozoicomonas sp. 8E]|uniref:WD40 repeat domain-containing protein n=1 Tax=Endozoicomonas sp. 8E TaxID=3035692 RepID=UPI0039776FE9
MRKNTIHENNVASAALSAEACHLLTGSRDNTAKIYRHMADGSWETITTIPHESWVNATVFSLDGEHALTASRDGTAKIYSLGCDGSWSEKACLSHDGWVQSASFSDDGSYVVTAGGHMVKITELKRSDLLPASPLFQRICTIL